MDGQYLPDDVDIDSLASSEPPQNFFQLYSEGGEVEKDIDHYAKGGDVTVEGMNKYVLSDDEDVTPTSTESTSPFTTSLPPYYGGQEAPETDKTTAKAMLKQLSTKGGGGKSKRSKGMSMELSGLVPSIPEMGAPQTEQDKLMQIASARSQYDALEQAYKLKAQAAQRAGRGFMRPTFNAASLESPTLEKAGPLMARTFQAGGLVRALKSVAKKGASSVDNVVPSRARSLFSEEASSFLPSIIKEEGGNWMGGSYSPETFVKPLYKSESLDNPASAKALNKWIDKKLTPYIKNKMATPSDPVRKLAEEQGILPFPNTRNPQAAASVNRELAGLPTEPIAKTPQGQAWENSADAAVTVGPYQNMMPFGYSNDPNETLRAFGGEFAVQNPTAQVSAMNTGRRPSDLGFDHIVDVLQENLTTGRLSPDSLKGLSMEDAVRLTHQYDLDMADKMKKAQIQSLEGVPVHKAYPKQGFRWLQLDKPGYFAAESDAMGHSVRGYEPPIGHADWTPQSGNKGRLGYGYGGWEGIKSGDVKVYSLADDMGKRYTTIEQIPSMHPLGTSGRGNEFPSEIRYGGSGTGVEESIPKEKLQEIYALGKKMYFENPNAHAENRLLSGAPTPSPMDSFQKAADIVLGKRPPSINQIKGPGNGYLPEDAQPFVQDFLNSGNWSTVNDLHLAGLRDIKEIPEVEKYIKNNNLDNRRFLTEAEYNKYEKYYLGDILKGQLGGFDPLAPVERAEGSPIGGEQRLTPQQIEQLAADQAALNTYQPVVNRNIQRQGEKSRALAQSRDVNQLPDPQTYAFIESALFGTSPEEVANKFSVFHPKRKEILGRAEQGFVTGNATLVGPAARMLKEVGAPVAKYLGKEAARQVERGMFNEGPLRSITPQPAFAVRPEGGGTTFTGVREPASSRTTAPISKFDKLIEAGANPRIEGLSNEMGDAIENFWRSKAQNYFTRQYGTPSDPVFKQIISGQLRTPALQRQIPDYALDQLNVGKTRVDPVTGESRFYPKYPQALEDLTRRYDEMTGLEGVSFNVKEPLFDPNYPSTMGPRGTQLEVAAREDVINKLIANGMNPNLINPKVTLTGPRTDAPDALLNYVPGEYKELYSMYANPPKDQNMIDRIYKELGLTEDVKPGVPENIKRAIETSEPIYDINFSYRSPLKDLLTPENINRYLATKAPAEINKMRFEDVVKNSAKYNLDMFNTQNLVEAIRSGKRVPEKVWTQGISEPLMTLGEGQNKFTWHRIVDNEATAVEGAYLGHSVGGYAKGGSYGPAEYRRFQEGQKQVFTLRDSKGKPFTTVEVEKIQTGPLGKELSPRELARAKAEGTELGPVMTVVRQIKGNGAKTGNTAPKDAEDQVLTFIKDYIRPDKISESDTYLTPKLETLKMDLSGRPRP